MKSFRIYHSGVRRTPTLAGYTLLVVAAVATMAAAWFAVRWGVHSNSRCAMAGFAVFAGGAAALRLLRVPVWRTRGDRPRGN